MSDDVEWSKHMTAEEPGELYFNEVTGIGSMADQYRIAELEAVVDTGIRCMEQRNEAYVEIDLLTAYNDECQSTCQLQEQHIAKLEALTEADGKEIGSYREGTGLRGENRALMDRIAVLEDVLVAAKAMCPEANGTPVYHTNKTHWPTEQLLRKAIAAADKEVT